MLGHVVTKLLNIIKMHIKEFLSPLLFKHPDEEPFPRTTRLVIFGLIRTCLYSFVFACATYAFLAALNVYLT